MNSLLQAKAILEASGLAHLMEAATALAMLTSQQQQQLSATPLQYNFTNIFSNVIEGGDTRNNNIVVDANDRNINGIGELSNVPNNNTISLTGREIFPERLMAILNDKSLSDIISWLPHGCSFVIIRPDVFADEVLPKYFPPMDSRSTSKYASFTRKLNRWGFRQANRGPDTGSFQHTLFRRDEPLLCLNMVCQRFRDSSTGKEKNTTTTSLSPRRKNLLPKPMKQKLVVQPNNVVTNIMTQQVDDNIHTVSEDGRSADSSTVSDEDVRMLKRVAQGTSSQRSFSTSITNDVELTRAALLRTNETERLHAAKAMLYESYCMAIRGE